ncbi:MAG TPA: hypothetical protein VII06_23085 [Chloroflexota bacterium]|jgi:hypothetical protein
MAEPRPPLTRDGLAALLAAAGYDVSAAEVDALARPTAAAYAAADSLDALVRTETEPAATFALPQE